jgi:hypothetical protein
MVIVCSGSHYPIAQHVDPRLASAALRSTYLRRALRYALWVYKRFPLGAIQTGGQSLDNGAVVLLFRIGIPLPTRLMSPALLAPA